MHDEELDEITLDSETVNEFLTAFKHILEKDGNNEDCVTSAKEYAEDSNVDVDNTQQLIDLMSRVAEQLDAYEKEIELNEGNEDKLKQILPIYDDLLEIQRGMFIIALEDFD